MEKDTSCKQKWKIAGAAILICDQIDFKTNSKSQRRTLPNDSGSNPTRE